ncbi:MAG TPA: hypothetical protein VJ044_18360 [Candidatus Hodarchaeales archaeon]|nr:hypothetical protein [Candidatus Hodarchaeales archaeon]
MQLLRFYDELERLDLPVYSVKDVARILNKPMAYVHVYLSRLVADQKLVRITRGRYSRPNVDPAVMATNVMCPSYLSFLAALSYHQLTTQIPRTFHVVVLRQRAPIHIGPFTIVFVRFQKTNFFGYLRDAKVFIAEPEKVIADGLYLPEYQPIRESYGALSSGSLDLEKLARYSSAFRVKAVQRRLGYLLELANIGIPEMLKRGRDGRKFSVLNPSLSPQGEKNKFWRLIINEVLE